MADHGDAFVVSGCRSAIGVLHGGVGGFPATQLGALAIKEAVRRAKLDVNDIDEVIMGQVVQGPGADLKCLPLDIPPVHVLRNLPVHPGLHSVNKKRGRCAPLPVLFVIRLVDDLVFRRKRGSLFGILVKHFFQPVPACRP